jgi:2-dehydro-3-deoxyphosphogluconate aldolase/(4S)-4-hydroxy-2-oxoglutarate aldolase
MSRDKDLSRILACGVIAVVRARDGRQLVDVVRALADGGVLAVEITFTVPGALDVIRHAAAELGDRAIIGAGTVLDTETARAALLAGASFVVSPTTNLDVIRLCRRYDKVVMPGAFTPTEILSPLYFKALKGPLPQVRVMPTGGVDLTTGTAFLEAGACCLGVGSQLVEPKAVAEGDFERIRGLARQYVDLVAAFRKEARP